MVHAISQDLDELGFIEGREYLYGPRNSGRTTRLLKAALAQLYFMDPGDEIWVISPTWENAKRMCERVANGLAAESGCDREKFLGKYHNQKCIEGFRNSPDGHSMNRYFLSFNDDKHIHFCAIEGLEHQLRGRRLSYSPCIFFDHICYEYGAIQDADFDLFALLHGMA